MLFTLPFTKDKWTQRQLYDLTRKQRERQRGLCHDDPGSARIRLTLRIRSPIQAKNVGGNGNANNGEEKRPQEHNTFRR